MARSRRRAYAGGRRRGAFVVHASAAGSWARHFGTAPAFAAAVIANVHTGCLSGVSARDVVVEVSAIRGLPGFELVGLPEAAVRESRVRVAAALANSGLSLPERRFVVNLAPADLRKSGASFDLAIAVALLAACGVVAPTHLDDTLFVGELSLDGMLRPCPGVLAQLRRAGERGLRSAVVAAGDTSSAALVGDLVVHAAESLAHVARYLNGVGELDRVRPCDLDARTPSYPDLADVRGQPAACRALEVAAAGEHNLLMFGPPGTGKTMLALRLPGLLPPLSSADRLEVATIAGAAGLLDGAVAAGARPFRAPHHSCSQPALVGGGTPIRPGEVTLAHGGVLFLDELPEFRRDALEALRPTMESGRAEIVRTRQRESMPAAPLVVAAMNPCPCGFQGDDQRICRCGPEQIRRYRARLSGPLLDRFDLHARLPRIDARTLHDAADGESTAAVAARVAAARAQLVALGVAGRSLRELSRLLHPDALRLLHRGMDQLGLSLRAYGKILRVSATLAALEGVEAVRRGHVAEAIQYRVLDRDEDRHGAAAPPSPRACSAPAERAVAHPSTPPKVTEERT